MFSVKGFYIKKSVCIFPAPYGISELLKAISQDVLLWAQSIGNTVFFHVIKTNEIGVYLVRK